MKNRLSYAELNKKMVGEQKRMRDRVIDVVFSPSPFDELLKETREEEMEEMREAFKEPMFGENSFMKALRGTGKTDAEKKA